MDDFSFKWISLLQIFSFYYMFHLLTFFFLFKHFFYCFIFSINLPHRLCFLESVTMNVEWVDKRYGNVVSAVLKINKDSITDKKFYKFSNLFYLHLSESWQRRWRNILSKQQFFVRRWTRATFESELDFLKHGNCIFCGVSQFFRGFTRTKYDVWRMMLF